MFSAVFFVAIGLLIDPALLAKYALPIGVITVAVVVGQAMSCSFGVFVAGHDTRTSLRVGLGLAQIGEFSFVIASLGLTLGVTSDFLYPIVVTVSAITTLTTPYLIKSSDHLVNWFDRIAPPKFVNYLALYTRWVGHGAQWPRQHNHDSVRKWTGKWRSTWRSSPGYSLDGFVGRQPGCRHAGRPSLERHYGWQC